MRRWRCFLSLALLATLPKFAEAACTLEVNVDSVIGPSTVDYLERAEAHAQSSGCGSILVLVNTPGGSLQSTRYIVERILNSKIPWLCFVSPSGGHAGSAGAIILQACHVNGAEPSTNIGAATPINATGEKMDEDLRKKILNDTTSWLDSLTSLRGRSQKFGRDIVTEAKSVAAAEALKLKAIDVVSESAVKFLEFARGRDVQLHEGAKTRVETGDLIKFPPDLRTRFLDMVTHPQIAYVLFMGSLGLLYFELTHPGLLVPGVCGAIGLVVSLISFHMLDVYWGALGLVILGVFFLLAEAFVPSFGALGLGGIVAFVVGSLLLFEPGSGVSVPLATILPTALGFGGMMMGLAFLAFRAQKLKRKSGSDSLVGGRGRVTRTEGGAINVEVSGEIWKAESESGVHLGDTVEVVAVNNLTLKVKKV